MTKRNLYILEFLTWSMDQYDSFLVSADNEKECVEIVKGEYPHDNLPDCNWKGGYNVIHIGETVKAKGILMSSYNAG